MDRKAHLTSFSLTIYSLMLPPLESRLLQHSCPSPFAAYASYTVGGAASSMRLCARSRGIGWSASHLNNVAMSFALPCIFSFDAGNLRTKLGFVLSAFRCAGLVISWLMVTEMRHCSRLFDMQLATRKSKHWMLDAGPGQV